MSALSIVLLVAIVAAAIAAMTVAVVALVRIPNTFVKVHAMSKAVVLGPILILGSSALGGEIDFLLRGILVGAFLIVTAPVAAHTIVRLERQRCDPGR